MEEVPAYRLIIAATIVFIVGLFVFTIIFRAFITFQQLQQTVIQSGNYTENQATLIILQTIPWTLGAFYVTLLGVVTYFLIKGSKPAKHEEPPPTFRRY